jgi:hypothetical protein
VGIDQVRTKLPCLQIRSVFSKSRSHTSRDGFRHFSLNPADTDQASDLLPDEMLV